MRKLLIVALSPLLLLGLTPAVSAQGSECHKLLPDDGQADDESPLVPMHGVASSLPKAKASAGSLNAADRIGLFDAVMAQLGEETEEEEGDVDASVARNLKSGLDG